MNSRLNWIEIAAVENMKLHHVCADNLAKDAGLTLALLLAGMGAGMAYSAKAIDAHSWNWFAAGSTGVTVWLALISWYLVAKCLMNTAIPHIYNEPRNLDRPEYSFDELRESELLGIQIRIDVAVARNNMLSDSLNRARLLAIASPLVFVIFAALPVVWSAVATRVAGLF